MAEKTITRSGNAQIDTAIKKYGTGSGLFAGGVDYLDVGTPTAFDFGSGNFTIDLWIYMTDQSTNPAFMSRGGGLGDWNGSNGGLQWNFFLYGNKLYFQWWDGAQKGINSASSIGDITNGWHHIAVVRNGSDIRIYLDGTSNVNGTATNLVVTTGGSQHATIGINDNRSGDNQCFIGNMDEVRICNYARWTTTFTPPTAQNTYEAANMLMLHMNGTDGSSTFTDSSADTSDTGVSGPAKLKTWNGLAVAKIKTINGLDIAKVKTINGLV